MRTVKDLWTFAQLFPPDVYGDISTQQYSSRGKAKPLNTFIIGLTSLIIKVLNIQAIIIIIADSSFFVVFSKGEVFRHHASIFDASLPFPFPYSLSADLVDNGLQVCPQSPILVTSAQDYAELLCVLLSMSDKSAGNSTRIPYIGFSSWSTSTAQSCTKLLRPCGRDRQPGWSDTL